MTNTLKAALHAIIAAALIVSGLAASAWAGEFYDKGGAAIRGYDAVAYFKEGKPVKGSPEHKFDYKGSAFHFSSQANRDAFAANPGKYAPEYNGFCAFGVAGGYKASVDPAAFTIVNDKLYLNYSQSIRKQWSADIPGFVGKGDKNWPAVSRQTKITE